MPSVDNRIVKMEFDNASFEHKINSTIASLGQLDKALKMEGAKKGLSDVSEAAGRFHMGRIGDAITGIASKFEALGVIGITVLTNLTNKAVNAGLQMAKSLSLESVISGFKEYELNIGSIQTILANTKADGTNLQQVNAALDELNQYADKTIYNFGQMTKNIGTFTAAGVDLGTSVQSIKGISNLAAISGSSADQAATAMYQLSQAVSTGTLKLMDWNSVVNAGMGGEVFQKALFETGKTLGTIPGIPIDKTFEEWTAGGNSFRSSLEKGWLTSEVLTTTLKGFTGEMTEAQLLAIGYTKEQAAEIMELGKTGVEAATKIRTLTGLISTTKESIGSGWSESFRTVIGNFEQATDLFSHINAGVSEMVSKNADARNELLKAWADAGGRQTLIYGLQVAFDNLQKIIAPIKEAFREIFPPATVDTLLAISDGIMKLAIALEPAPETIDRVKRIFKGFFSALEIGWEIIKQTASFIGDLFDKAGAGSGKFLEFAAKIGDFFTALNDKLIEGEGIKNFFKDLQDFIADAIPFVDDLKDKIIDFSKELVDKLQIPLPYLENLGTKLSDFFTGLDPKVPEVAGAAIERLGSRFDSLKGYLEKLQDVWEPVKEGLKKIGGVLDEVWEEIKSFFSELGTKIAEALETADWDAVTDALNVGLLAAIAGILGKFLSGGLKIDIGEGFLANISTAFEQLTGVFEAMQTRLKAEALMKIAIAIGIMTASVVALSLIDSGALTKALVAMSVGFGQLMAAFGILSKIDIGFLGGAKFAAMAVGMTLLSGAIFILAAAAKNLADLDWNELARGLVGVGALLAMITIAVIPLAANTGKLIATSLGLIGIAVALNILAGAVKIFATMSWGDMAQGLAGVGLALAGLVLALKLMPAGPSLVLQGAGLLAIAVSMNILAGAVAIFATMSWAQIGKGMAAMAGALLAIGLAMNLFPATMPLIGIGLLLVSVSLIAIAAAMKMMAGMSWAEIGRGLTAMAGALLVLGVAMYAMQSSIAGAAAIGIAAASLLLLVTVVKAFASVSWGDLLHGLLAMGIALAALALGALALQPAIPAMLALGAALTLIGVGFALFGVGAMLVAKAFELLAKAGKKGAETLVVSMEAIGKALPTLVRGFAEGILELITMIGEFAPQIIETLGKLLSALITKLTELLPQLGEFIRVLIEEVISIIEMYVPRLVEAGINIITALLTGIRDNIGGIVTLVGEIITNFIDAFGTQLTSIVSSVATMITNFFTSVAEAVGKVAATLMVGIGIAFINGFMDGITQALPGPMSWFTNLAKTVLGWIGSVLTTLVQKGSDLIAGLLSGIVAKAAEVITWFGNLAGDVIRWVGSVLTTLSSKGRDLIAGLLSGIIDKASAVTTWFGHLANNVITWVGNVITTLWRKGYDLIQGLLTGITDKFNAVTSWLGSLGSKILGAVGDVANSLYNIGRDVINGFLNGMKDVWGNVTSWISSAASHLPGFIKGPLGIGSPSKVFIEIGENIIAGLTTAFSNDNTLRDSSEELVSNTTKIFEDILSKMTENLGSMEELNPVVTPVLDMTRLIEDAKKINNYLPSTDTLYPTITPTYSISQARTIAQSATEQAAATGSATGTGQVTFEQNIYAPKQLSTSDIYKQTRNQIAIAKEELKIR
ncbi:MAG: tape measure protein [Paenisporosarcina sp.]